MGLFVVDSPLHTNGQGSTVGYDNSPVGRQSVQNCPFAAGILFDATAESLSGVGLLANFASDSLEFYSFVIYDSIQSGILYYFLSLINIYMLFCE